MYYSPSRLAFINLSTPAWSDLRPVSAEVYKDISEKLAAGTHVLDNDEDGNPIAVEAPPKPEQTPDELFAVRMVELNQSYNRATNKLFSTYPLVETISWNDQTREARDLIAAITDDTPLPETPFLTNLHSRRVAGGIEESLEQLARRVIELHGIITPPFADITGKRHLAERQLQTAKTAPDAIDALNAVNLELESTL